MEHISNYYKSIVYNTICSMKHSCHFLIIIYVLAAISMIILLLVVFCIFLKIKEKNRLRRRQLTEQRRRNLMLRQQMLRQDSILSYEAAIQIKNPISSPLAQISETYEFILPSYDEALKLKYNSI